MRRHCAGCEVSWWAVRDCWMCGEPGSDGRLPTARMTNGVMGADGPDFREDAA